MPRSKRRPQRPARAGRDRTSFPSGSPSPDTKRFEEAFLLHRQGRAGEAFAAYEVLLATLPRHADALHFSGLLLHQAGRHDEAAARIEHALRIDARAPDPWSNLALVYHALGRREEAMRALETALQRDATLAEVWVNLSSLRLDAGDAAGAEAAARRALAHVAAQDSTHGARFNLALALAAQKRHAEALDAARAAAAEAPDAPGPVGLQAQVLGALGRREEAVAMLGDYLARRDDAHVRLERARLFDMLGNAAAALADYARVMASGPPDDAVFSEFIFLKKRLCEWKDLSTWQERFREAALARAACSEAGALTPFSFLSDASTRAEQLLAATTWSRRYVQTAPTPRTLSTGRLRIGYLSADLHEHATGVLAAGLFEQHDRAAFVVHGYSTGPDDGSALRARLVAGFDHFLDARDLSDAHLAERIRADRIDILIDLKGHTDGATTGVLALRPAPIQVNYLGYPGTMGAPFIDYLIGDAIVTPFEHAADYSETLIHLPACYQINDERRVVGEAQPRCELGLPDRAFVFCCFNNGYKIGPDVFETWMRILRAVPNSVLWLLARNSDAAMVANLRSEAARRDVAPERLVFAASRPNAEYLALYRHADLFLDTWPYNAHTTASDALWAGCPLLTVLGQTFAGRVAASLLTAVGLPELITASVEDYVGEAILLATDYKRLERMRDRLNREGRSSPLFDTRATTRAIEHAYQRMAEQYRAGVRRSIRIE